MECGDDLRSRHVVTSRAVVYRDVSLAGGEILEMSGRGVRGRWPV